MKRRVLFEAVLAALPLAVMGAATNPDESFFKDAARGGLSEVGDGMLAQEQGSSPAVRDFGALMVQDHTKANKQLEMIAAADSVTLPSNPTPKQTREHQRLKSLSGPSFDKDYMHSQIHAHQETAALFRKEMADGQDAKARQFAADTLPIVESHLRKGRSISGGL